MPVSSLEDVPETMTTLIIPAATYAVFRTRKGPVAEVVCEAWEYIWKWSKENKRTFTIDFELYDERATDPNNAQLDIYIALVNDKKKIPFGIFFLSLKPLCKSNIIVYNEKVQYRNIRNCIN